MIVSMFAEVLAEFLYSLGEYRYLYFSGSCVVVAKAVLFNNGCACCLVQFW